MADGDKIAQALRDELEGDVVAPGDSGWDDARQRMEPDRGPEPRRRRLRDVGRRRRGDRAGRARRRPGGRRAGHRPRRRPDGAPRGSRAAQDRSDESGSRWTPMPGPPMSRRGSSGWRCSRRATRPGLAALAGSSPDVGIVGYSLGGGLGWLGRRHGLACNTVKGFDVVTADGEERRVDADTEPDLFWAMRGGGGSFAIVTAMDIGLVPAREIYAGAIIMPAESRAGSFRATESGRRACRRSSPRRRLLHLPPIPQVPEPLRDRDLVAIGACYLGPEDEAVELLAPIRGLVPSRSWTSSRRCPPRASCGSHGPRGSGPRRSSTARCCASSTRRRWTRSSTLRPRVGLAAALGGARQLGGALSRPAEGGGALSHLDAASCSTGSGCRWRRGWRRRINGHSTVSARRSAAGSRRARTSTSPSGRPAFADLFSPRSARRLAEVKREWDPDNVIRANHAVPAAA